mgnify:CR=1 FL=1
MNFRELEKANGLLNEIKNIDRMTEDIVDYNYVEIETEHAGSSFEEKFINVLKEIRNELVEELKELGVTEV